MKHNNKHKQTIIFVLSGIFMLFCQMVNAQEIEQTNIKYNWLVVDSMNIIEGENNLLSYFEKLQKLSNGEIDRVNVVHIGDSHIQADLYSGTMRQNLQTIFGNAGRGLIFPHKVAKSNSATDLYSFSNAEWESYRNLHNQNKYSVGLSGFVIATQDSNAILKISVNEKSDLNYSFNKLTFLHPLGSEYFEFMLSGSKKRDVLEENSTTYENITYKVKSGDVLGKIAAKYNTSVSQLKALNGLKNDNIYIGQTLKISKVSVNKPIKLPENTFHDFQLICCTDSACTVIELDTTLNFAFMRNVKSITNQNLMQWDGIVLENTNQNGVLYHTIGVNGAMYSHFNKSPRFFEQLPILKPDLIIVSLGTNEALNARIDAVFENDISLFYEKIRKSVGDIPIIITTPPDNRKHPHSAKIVGEKLADFAANNNISIYNLYEVLGGVGSFQKMQSRSFAQADKVHFTQRGYIAMGELMFEALMNSYIKFIEDELE